MGEKTITTQVKIDGEIVPDFSFDWEVAFQGEKYIMPLRIPQGAKENTSLNSTIDLTFQHWAIYQLKRWPFVTIQQIAAGTYLPDEEVATVQLNLGDFCILFGQVLKYYYGDAIKIDLNPAWEYKQEATIITISHTKIWNVLIDAFHDKYGVRWEIKAASDNSNTVKGGERYVIRVGYPTTEVDHIFEYGFEGGLLKVERQVQSEEIRNMLKGRGGDKNIPFRYFKDTDPNNPGFRPDPDWVEELANIPFTNLMPATFRSYVQGWKAAHISKYPGYVPKGESNAYAPWAYRKGYTDTKFAPVEFVADEITINPTEGDKQVEILPGYSPYVKKGSSLNKYGPLPDTLDNNDDIYPTLQGTGMDIAVDVEQIITDNTEGSTPPDVTISNISGATVTVSLTKEQRKTVTTGRVAFSIPRGRTGNLIVDAGTPLSNANKVTVESHSVRVYTADGSVRSASGIPSGSYEYDIELNVYNTTKDTVTAKFGAPSARIQDAVLANVAGGTFDMWVKNIWNTQKGMAEDGSTIPGETDSQYSERVWKPVLGDREGNTAKVVFTSGELAMSEDYEFTIVDFPVPDTSRNWEEKDSDGNVIATHTSHWRIRLAKSDAELEATGLYVPSTKKQGKAGDTFVFIGTEMTHVPYVVDAEKRLDDWKKDQLGEVKEIKPTFVVTTDRVRLNGEGKPDALINQLRVGNSVTLQDKRFIDGPQQVNLYLQSITYTYREPTKDDAALNPDVELVLSNDYSASANPVTLMQGEISALQRQVGALSNIGQAIRKIGDNVYLRKDKSDRTPYGVRFGSGIEAGDYIPGVQGGSVDGDGNAELLSLLVRAMAGSARFVDGLAGEGWRVWLADGLSHLAVDELTVRRTMTVFELLIEKIRSVGGQICVSEADGKIRSVETDNAGNYLIEFEQENTFMPHDLMRCKRWGGGQTDYWVEISAVTDGKVVVAAAEFGGYVPAAGDECVLMGNTVDTRRQSLILISATEDGQPRIDVMDGVRTKSFAGCLRARLGNLDGISDATFGTGCQPHGYGLYSDNAYLRGVFLLDTGEDVKTRFEIVEGKVESSVESVRRDLSPQGYLANQDFSEGSTAWITGTGQRWLSAGGSWLMAQGRLLSQPGAAPAAITDGHLRLNNGSATQYNADMATRPDGETQTAVSIALSVETAGTLTVRLGSTEGKNITLTETLDATDGRVIQVATEGLWDGTGDFTIRFTGNATVRQCVVSDDRAATLAWRYRTLFEQSDTLLRLSAENFDAEGNVLEGSAIEQSARNVSIEVKEEIDGALKRTGIDISSGEITATADRMKFTDAEGNTQALIEDGKLNIGAVEAGYVMVGDPQGESVEISPDTRSVVIRDTEGNVCQELSGRIGGGAPEDVSSAIAISIAAGTESITPTGVKTMKILKERWRVDADAVLSAGSMTLGVTARVADIPVMKPGYESASGATATFTTVRICRYGDSESTERLWSYTLADIYVAARADASGNRTATAEKTFTRPTLSIPAGWYEVQLEMTVTANHTSASGGSIAGGSATWGSIAGVLESNQYVSRYYGNGFTLGASSNNYASAWYGSDGMHFESRSGDSGLRMDAAGVERYIGGQWTPIPALIFFGRWTWNASASTYTLNTGARTLAGVMPTLTRVNTGHVIVAIPQEWRTALGTKLTVDRMRVLVTSLDSLLKASVEGTLSTNAVQISMADSRTSGDGSFALSIEII